MPGKHTETQIDLVKHGIYTRREIHDQYGGQRQGGISTPQNFPVVFLFTGPTGQQHGYGYDGWRDSTTFLYTGEGRPDKGDMQFTRGNRAIRDHESTGKRIFLFEQLSGDSATQGQVRLVGEFRYRSHRIEQRDSAGTPRDVIVFELGLID